MKRLLVIFMLFASMIVTNVGLAQTDNVVSRNISKIIKLTRGDVFSIIGEKADIKLKGWDKDYAELKITFSAEHKDRAIAMAELEYMHYSLSREKNTVELRNAFLLPNRTDRIQSRIRVAMDVMLPFTNKLSVYDKYGNIEIRDVSCNLSVELEFSDLLLNDVSGTLNVKSLYSVVRGEELGLSYFISDDEESKYILSLDKGSYRFNSKHGDLDLTLGSIQSLTVNATHTDVTIQPADHEFYNYQLVSQEGRVFVPRQLVNPVIKESKRSKFVLTRRPASPLIDIKTTFNTITIQ